jgi:hypothetical protein
VFFGRQAARGSDELKIACRAKIEAQSKLWGGSRNTTHHLVAAHKIAGFVGLDPRYLLRNEMGYPARSITRGLSAATDVIFSPLSQSSIGAAMYTVLYVPAMTPTRNANAKL